VTDLEWIKVYQIINYHPSASGSYNYDVRLITKRS